MKINNIVFYCPSRNTGGVEYLFSRLSNHLAESQDHYRIFYVDYYDGFSHNAIRSNKVTYIEYRANEKVSIPDHSVLILQLNLISEIDRFAYNPKESLCLFWCLHFLNIRNQIYAKGHFFISKRERMQLGEEIKWLSERNVIKFLAGSAYVIVQKDFYQNQIKLDYIPNIAPIKSYDKNISFKRINQELIKFCWLGRLDAEKSLNIITYMNELEEVNKTKKVSLSIIGLGKEEERLKNLSRKYTYPITFEGEKREKELDSFIREKVEIGLASGTSAFEFSLRGKPVIVEWLLDHEYKAGERQSYTLTYESEDIELNKTDEIVFVGQSSFKNKLDIILNDYERESEKCYSFVINKNETNCARSLINNIESIAHEDSFLIEKHLKKTATLINRGAKRKSNVWKLKKILTFHWK